MKNKFKTCVKLNAIKTILLFVVLIFHQYFCFGQDYQWWNTKHNWDGVTPWYNYIIISPKFMGPNALPVPIIKNGMISQNSYFSLGVNNHFLSGDKTENLSTELYIRLFSPRVGLNIEIVPIEHYKMDTLTRDIRRARSFNGEGFASGDFYIGTYIQLIQNVKKLPDVLLTINFKTASGYNLYDARYTDTPGYFFDLSFGKKINLNKQKTKFIKPFLMLGFYCWQILGNAYRQNDAFLYGVGSNFIFSHFEIKNSFGGYYGYIGNGDKPMVYRLSLSSTFNTVLNYEVKFQQGLHDINYSSFGLSCNINLDKIKKK